MSECSVAGGSLSCNLADQSTCCQPKSLTARLLPIILLTQFSITGLSIELCMCNRGIVEESRKKNRLFCTLLPSAVVTFMSMSCCAVHVKLFSFML